MIKNNLVSLVTFVAFAILFAGFAAAQVSIKQVEVNEMVMDSSSDGSLAVIAGETIPVRVTFHADENMSDVRVKILVSGSNDASVSTGRFNVFEGMDYTRLLSVQIPSDIDFPNENVVLEIRVESDGVAVDTESIELSGQREEYLIDILDVEMENRVAAGDVLTADIVLKNEGFETSEDTFVQISVPALAIQKRAYFSDLTPVDQADPDKEDAASGKISLSIPANTPAGIYNVLVTVFNDDASQTVTKKIAVVGSGSNSMVVSSANEKTFSPGASATYSVTVVNSGNKIKLYTLSIDAPAELSVESDDTVFAVPAGSSKTVQVKATAQEAGKYNFAVSVNSDEEIVKTENFVANVEGRSRIGSGAGNATIVLTVVLAIIFVVLLVVLIVLLTRKPQKSEELGESYY